MTEHKFKIEKNCIASIVHNIYIKGSQHGIDFNSPWTPLTSEKAREFAQWLLEAADKLEELNDPHSSQRG